MELSGVNNTNLQSVEQKITEKKTDEKATPNHGGGGIHISDKKVASDSVNISAEATKKLANEQVSSFHGGGVYVPPDV
jgi:hypothetical protein